MSKTSSAAKYKYNRKTYKQFNVHIKPELFEQIAEICVAQGLSRAQFLQRATTALSEKSEG